MQDVATIGERSASAQEESCKTEGCSFIAPVMLFASLMAQENIEKSPRKWLLAGRFSTWKLPELIAGSTSSDPAHLSIATGAIGQGFRGGDQ